MVVDLISWKNIYSEIFSPVTPYLDTFGAVAGVGEWIFHGFLHEFPPH